MNYIFVTGLFAPIWFPLLRLIISFNRSSRLTKAVILWYDLTLIWSIGWIVYLWVIRVPSGIGYLLALQSGWLIMLAAIVTEIITIAAHKGRKRKEIVSARFSLILIIAMSVVIGYLWSRHEYRQHEYKVEGARAVQFVKNNNDVIQKGGSSSPLLIVATTTTHDGVPVTYEIETKLGYAIVSVIRSPSGREFRLDCITSLSHGKRDPLKNPCEQ